MSAINQVVEYSNDAIELAIRRCIITTGTTEVDGAPFESFRNSRNIEGSITEGDGCEVAEFVIDHFNRVELIDGRIGRDGYGGMDEDVRVFEDLQEAVSVAADEFARLSDYDKERRYFSVQIITEGEYSDEVARFDGDLVKMIAEGAEE